MNTEGIIYMDYNATFPLLEEVKNGMIAAMDNPQNSSSVHHYGRTAKNLVESARTNIAKLIGIDDTFQVIFTSSGTESNNIALRGFNGYKVLTTPVEHLSVLSVVGHGIIPINQNGLVKLDDLEVILQNIQGKFLVSVQHANNETGVIQDVKTIAELVHKYNGIFHTDATQTFGKINFSNKEINADLITLSGHKFGGPIGSAALVFKKNLPLQPLMIGGGQEYRFRPGTLNTLAIHGLGIAAKQALNLPEKFHKLKALRDYLEDEILKTSPNTIIFGRNVDRLPNTSSISMTNTTSETQVIYFDVNKICISAGSACSSGKVNIPYVLMSMGYNETISNSAIRVSLGPNSSKAEIDKFIALWKELFTKNNEIKKAS
jgi:cysteine desulfurase